MLKKLIREKKQIKYTKDVTGRGDQAEEHKVTTKDIPLPAFTDSLNSLGAVCAKLLKLINSPGEKVMCRGLHDLTVAPNGLRMIKLSCIQNLKHFCTPLEMVTPAFPIDELDTGEVKTKKHSNLNDAEIDIIIQFIDAAIAYTDGQRAQGEFELDDDPYAPEPNAVKEGDDLDFNLTVEESHFHKRVDACKTQAQLVELVQEVFKQDWNGSDMKLPDLKLKAKNHYSQNRDSIETK